MRPLVFALCAGICLIGAQAEAGVRTVTKVKTYRVTGDSGAALMSAMERNGPSQGFLARAIAQTRYSVAWELGWKVSDERCRLQTADVTLSINYRFPELAGKASPGSAEPLGQVPGRRAQARGDTWAHCPANGDERTKGRARTEH